MEFHFGREKCSNCGMPLPKSGRVCPHCGAERDSGCGGYIFIFVILLILFIIGKIVGKDKDKANDPAKPKTEQLINKTPAKKHKKKRNKKKRSHSKMTVDFVTIDDNNATYWKIL